MSLALSLLLQPHLVRSHLLMIGHILGLLLSRVALLRLLLLLVRLLLLLLLLLCLLVLQLGVKVVRHLSHLLVHLTHLLRHHLTPGQGIRVRRWTRIRRGRGDILVVALWHILHVLVGLRRTVLGRDRRGL